MSPKFVDIPGSGRLRVATPADVKAARAAAPAPSRSVSLGEYLSYFTFNGSQYGLGLNQSNPGEPRETVGADYPSFVSAAYYRNPIVAGCVDARMFLFSEANFQYRQRRSGRPGDLFGSPELAILEEPWPGATTGDMLSRAEQDASFAGNWFGARRGDRIERLRPDWVEIVIAADDDREEVLAWDIDAEVVGYAYTPGGPASGRDPELFFRQEVAHYAPKPDPLARFRGMSWLTSVIREIVADGQMTDHKSTFLENAATPNMVVKLDATVRGEAFDAFVQKFRAGHEGPENRGRTLFLGGGADATVVGSSFEQMDFKAVQGAGETRICMAARVPAVIAQISEGLQGSSLNQGNYGMARRMFVDMTMRYLWRNMAGSLASIVDVPANAELWYDDRDIPALRENEEDVAKIQLLNAQTAATYVKEGWEPDSVIDAISAGDMKRLKHSGLASVQLQPAGQNANGAAPEPEPAESVPS